MIACQTYYSLFIINIISHTRNLIFYKLSTNYTSVINIDIYFLSLSINDAKVDQKVK